MGSQKMRTAKSKLEYNLFAVIILIGIISINTGFSLLTANYSISTVGRIRYGPMQTKWLHTEGRYIKDEDGNTVILRGFNKQDFLDFPDGSWPMEGEDVWAGQGNFRDEAVRQHMRHWRDVWQMNIVRFHLNMRWWLDNERVSPYTGETSNIGSRDAVIRTIEIAEEEGIYVLIDFFQVDFGEEQQDLPFPSSLLPNANAFTDFWVDDVIPYIRHLPNVIYELWNEPAGSMGVWFDAATQTINAIRATGDNHIIRVQYLWCGELEYVADWVAEDRPTENIIFGIHNYRSEGSFEDNPNSPTDYQYIHDYLWGPNTPPGAYPPTGSNYGEVLETLNLPVWVGEFAGVRMATDDDEYDYFVNNLQVYKEWGVGWTFYCWDYDSHYCAQKLTGTAFQPPNRGGQAMIDSITSP